MATKVIQIGLGPVGQRMVQFGVERSGIEYVAAVDPAADKVGRDLGAVCGIKPLGIKVQRNLRSALRNVRADVAVLTTVSDIKRIEPQVAEIAGAGLDMVSTCEELVFPWKAHSAAARRIDAVCRRHGVTCLSTGVNPGFLMDALPIALTAICRRVRKIVVRRIQDASIRRIPFQQKIGAGLTLDQFRAKKAAGTLRHVGLTESMHMIAARMGWKLTRTSESLKPVIARRAIGVGYIPILRGMACGVEQIGRAFVGTREVITLEFRAAVGEPSSHEQIKIIGEPDITSTIPGGINGDVATCAIVLNAVPQVVAAEPGLKTMMDIPAVACGK